MAALMLSYRVQEQDMTETASRANELERRYHEALAHEQAEAHRNNELERLTAKHRIATFRSFHTEHPHNVKTPDKE